MLSRMDDGVLDEQVRRLDEVQYEYVEDTLFDALRRRWNNSYFDQYYCIWLNTLEVTKIKYAQLQHCVMINIIIFIIAICYIILSILWYYWEYFNRYWFIVFFSPNTISRNIVYFTVVFFKVLWYSL